MARYLNIEIGASQMRLAEVEPHGRGERILNCFTCSVPAGAVDDGLVRDTKGLGQLLKNEIARHNIHSMQHQSRYPQLSVKWLLRQGLL